VIYEKIARAEITENLFWYALKSLKPPHEYIHNQYTYGDVAKFLSHIFHSMAEWALFHHI
jgi:hypothetical protein